MSARDNLIRCLECHSSPHGAALAADAILADHAHELAEQIYRRAEEADVAGQRSFASGAHAAGTWIDPEVK